MSTTHLVRAEELLKMGGDAWYEPIEGMLHEVSPSSSKSSVIGARLFVYVGQFVLEHDLGYTTSADGGFILSRHPDTVVTPDIGFFRGDRYQGEFPSGDSIHCVQTWR